MSNPPRPPKGTRFGGRTKGTPNKVTQSAKRAIELAFEGIGGVDAFVAWAKENQTDFYKIYSKMLPKDIKVEGDLGLTVQVVRFTDADSTDSE